MAIKIDLNEHGDRVVNLQVTDKHGEVYSVMLEFLNHDFGEDDVQVSVHKLPKDCEEIFKEKGSCPIYSPNTVLHHEKVIDRKTSDHHVTPNIWYEFHEVDGLPAVKSCG